MRGNFGIDADSVGVTYESCVWRGSKLFFGRGSGKFCGEVSGSDSNRFSVFFVTYVKVCGYVSVRGVSVYFIQVVL